MIHAPDGKDWWTWVVKFGESSRTVAKMPTVFAKSEKGRAAKLASPRVAVLRAWDEARWRE